MLKQIDCNSNSIFSQLKTKATYIIYKISFTFLTLYIYGLALFYNNFKHFPTTNPFKQACQSSQSVDFGLTCNLQKSAQFYP